MVTPEIPPLRTTGGLADAVHGLSRALVQKGHSVSVFVPAFQGTIERAIRDVHFKGQKINIQPTPDISIKLGSHPTVETWILKMDIPLSPHSPEFLMYYFIDTKEGNWFGNRNKVYGYSDDAFRFLFFDKVIADFYIRTQQSNGRGNKSIIAPNVIHGHDWATGYLGYFLRHFEPQLRKIPFVYNVHNIGYAETLPINNFKYLTNEVNPWIYSMHGLEFHGEINPHKAAFVFADRIVFVSPTHQEEAISGNTPPPSDLYSGFLQVIRDRTRGVLNGIPDDFGVELFVQNGTLPQSYGPGNLDGKVAARKLLQEVTRLSPDDQSLIMVSSGRWAEQKATDVLIDSLQRLFNRSGTYQFVTVGSEAKDSTRYQKRFRQLQSRFPGRVAFFDFNQEIYPGLSRENLEALVMAGGDVYLMPSLYEPCGLGQMKALKMGTPVIANRTGGLADTIEDGVTGFLFDGVTIPNIISAVTRANSAFKSRPDKRAAMITAGMQQDFSWSKAADRYLEIYTESIDFWAGEA
jgi:starch synthase